MKTKKNLFLWALVIALISACSVTSSGEPATPTTSPSAEEGQWAGDSVGLASITFTVTAENKIADFKIDMPVQGGNCIINYKDEFAIEPDGTFIIGEIDSEGKLQRNSVRGTFETLTTLTGDLSGTWECALSSGAVQLNFLPSALTKWQAEFVEP